MVIRPASSLVQDRESLLAETRIVDYKMFGVACGTEVDDVDISDFQYAKSSSAQ